MFNQRTMPQKSGATIPNSISNPTLSSISKSDQSFLRVHEESRRERFGTQKMMGEEAENGRVRRERFGTQKRRRSEFIVYCNEDKQSISQGGRSINGIQIFLTASMREAEELLERRRDLENTSGSDANIWGSLLGACRNYGDTEAEHLIQLKPEHSEYYTLLSNMYAETGRGGMIMQIGTNKPSSFHPPKIIQQYKSFAVAITWTLQTSNTRKVTSVEIIAGISHIKKHITTNWKHVPIHHLGVIAQS
ncbi:hypothetical protein RHSIM_Rhsim13G0204500 [Rhododendron simsii]|uniref:Uncharacterized protein n=1 Tax=Rhododendron simsii TaxID=118357 RepID=A0A834G089_RHOSS|nr:hypothetical protein RHSIM_Rhsim13G0204500 [Rhododendron simsii]